MCLDLAILIVYFGYKFTKSKAIALVLALYPPLIYNSAIWGSGDSLVSLFALLGIYFLWHKKYLPSIFFLLFSFLYKSSLLIWIPIIPIILIKNKISVKNILLSSSFLLALVYIICLPFNPVEINPIFWFFQTMLTKILPGFMDLVTANAMNFWAIIYGLKPQIDGFLILNLITARAFSLIVCVILYLYVLIQLFKNYSPKYLLLTLINITLITFTFMTRMHERYTFPALIPLLMLSHYDRRFIKYFVILSITHMVNIVLVWPLTIYLYNNYIIFTVSFINVVITLKLVFFNFDKKRA